jgi:hypothetical protein
MRGSVCLDIFMEFGTSFFLHCINILLKLVFIYISLEFHARLVLKDQSHFVRRRMQNEHATHCLLPWYSTLAPLPIGEMNKR